MLPAKNKPSDFRNLQVWHQSRWLIIELFRITGTFSNQVVRQRIQDTSVAIATNIALAFRCHNKTEETDYLNKAITVATNLQASLLQANQTGLLNQTDYRKLEIGICEIRDLLFADLSYSKN